MIDYREIVGHMDGQWGEFFNSVGLQIPQMKGVNSKNMPCPLCGGDDRAHWRDESGRLVLYCRNCAADKCKSPEDVYQELTGCGFRDLVVAVSSFLGISEETYVPDTRSWHEKILSACEQKNAVDFLEHAGVKCDRVFHIKDGCIHELMIDCDSRIVDIAVISTKGVTFNSGRLFADDHYTRINGEGVAIVCARYSDGLRINADTKRPVIITYHNRSLEYLCEFREIKERFAIACRLDNQEYAFDCWKYIQNKNFNNETHIILGSKDDWKLTRLYWSVDEMEEK